MNNLTDGILNTFVVALLLGITLRATGIFKPAVLSGIDSFGIMMIAIMILVFGPLATVKPSDVAALAFPLLRLPRGRARPRRRSRPSRGTSCPR